MSRFFSRRVRDPDALDISAFRDSLSGAEMRDLFDYWNAARDNGATMPRRADIDPLEIPKTLLPYLYIVIVEADGGYRFRLAGTRMAEVFKHDVTGKRLEQVLEAHDLKNAVRSYGRVVQSAAPWYSRVTYKVDGVSGILYQRLTLPLGEGGVVTHLLGGLTIHRDHLIYEDFYESHGRHALDVEDRLEAVLTL
ncbi:PAS domain-containing protein [Pacificispira sp.]|uniref:PAS domain-containing protein n=1 Tax=Pacificispira sp. TaxID=2888761 RepID=UPI003B518D45